MMIKINDNTIVLYPDRNEYNPLNSKYVIRMDIIRNWKKYRQYDFYKKWNINDFVYHLEKSINNPKLKILNPTLLNPIFITNI